jgi:fucose 4-O-acetylase-like acetyltransferase
MSNNTLSEPEQTFCVKAPRENWMDVAKGLAIAAVVLVHVLRGMSLADLGLEHQSNFLYIDYTATTFLMPLFFMMSGALYSKEKKLSSLNEYTGLLQKKFIRLGVPYFIFSLIQGLMRLTFNNQANVSFSASKLLLIPFQPFDHFWFLYALLLVFCLIPLLELYIRNDRLILLLLLGLNLLSTVFNIQWSIGYFFINGIYFYFGTVLYRHYKHLLTHSAFLFAMSVLYLVTNPFCFGLDKAPPTPFSAIVYVFQAITGSILGVALSQLLLSRFKSFSGFCTILGRYSFEIYLLHSLFTASTRVFLVKLLHISSPAVHIATGLTLGLLLPLVIAKVAPRFPFLHFAFFPGQYWGRKEAKPMQKPEIKPVGIA